MPASTNNKQLFPPDPPFHPERRAKAIQDAIAKKKIKRTSVTDDILVLLSQIIEQGKRSA